MLADRGFDVIVVDQTRPEQRALGLATASVLVPGLLPIDFGWARQRALRHAAAAHRAAGGRPGPTATWPRPTSTRPRTRSRDPVPVPAPVLARSVPADLRRRPEMDHGP